jgi:hypothetical protein
MNNFKVGDRVVFKHWNPPYPYIYGKIIFESNDSLKVMPDKLYHPGCTHYNFQYTGLFATPCWLEVFFNSPLYNALKENDENTIR